MHLPGISLFPANVRSYNQLPRLIPWCSEGRFSPTRCYILAPSQEVIACQVAPHTRGACASAFSKWMYVRANSEKMAPE